MGIVIRAGTVGTIETDVPGLAAVIVLDHTMPVTILVEPVRQGIMEASVGVVAARTVQEIKREIDILEPAIAAILDGMETFVAIVVALTVPDHTTPVTVPVEPVRQAVSLGTEIQSVLNESKVYDLDNTKL